MTDQREKVYAWECTGTDGLMYSVHILATPETLSGLQAAGIVGDVCEVIGMQQCADAVIAGLEMQMYTACGGALQ